MAAPLPELLLPDAAAWRAWLEEHHAEGHGVRLVLHKKGGDVTALTYAQAVQEVLCFGWIDGQAGSRDEGSYTVRMTPRRPGSMWSARNVGYVEKLIEAGRMHPAGLAEVATAKANGRWEAAYAGGSSAEPPRVFLDGLAADPAAAEAYARLNASNRYAIYHRLQTLKTEAARTRRAAEFVAMLAAGQAPSAQPGFTEAPRRPRRS
ncbi:YdeI/OmpD-associated family protein [Zafaria sp. Z1313]|uniref:YdeI/OmpD-associated family protein n=1 Tax=unclassified Zafaria TaxID=2828765 RepID=UPI002E7826CB|nr:YdeI/OmpD-associated family protein [Zafaria sp. J156]MEE1621846.1 YdeI/OmpD-associated family protein [Zafaria sp. J156]